MFESQQIGLSFDIIKVNLPHLEYLIDKIERFEQFFPKSSTDYLKQNHYRLYLLKNKVKNFYFKMNPPKHLLDFSKIDSDSIPIVINNYNRFATLKNLVEWLIQLDDKVSVIILDNKSSFEPLLKYYDRLDLPNVQVVRFQSNYCLSKLIPISQALQDFDNYVVTDADLIPYTNTPNDMLSHMISLMKKYPDVNHIGASLEINDLPDHFPLKKEVYAWEERWWKVEREPHVYEAFVDTTFAMYKRSSKVLSLYPSLRVGRPYTLKHVDWYVDPKAVNNEMKHNLKTMTPISTWMTRMKISLEENENSIEGA